MLETALKPLIDYFMELGAAGVAIVAYLEAMFFPLPPDLLLFAYALCKAPKLVLLYSLIAGIASSLGALTNYFIGLKGGRKLFHIIFKNQHQNLDKIEKMYQKYGVLTVFIVAFTPIPFMVFTMASGIFELALAPFLLACFIGRTMRFFTFSLMIIIFGASIKDNIEIFFIATAFIIVSGYFLINKKKEIPKI